MTTNFLQFDPTGTNMESDGSYSASTYRQNGVVGGLAPSGIHNKLYYQVSTMAACIGQVLSDFAQTVADSDVSGLVASLKAVFAWAGTNTQTGTSYTVLTTDRGKIITFSNAAAIAVTLPQANTAGFDDGFSCKFVNLGAGAITITPTTSTINGRSSFVVYRGMGTEVYSDGANYFTPVGRPQDHPSANKARATVTVSGGVATLQAGSYGVSSVSRTGTGLYTVNFSTNFADTTYSAIPVCATAGGGNNLIGAGWYSKAVGSCGIGVVQNVSSTDNSFDVIFAGLQ